MGRVGTIELTDYDEFKLRSTVEKGGSALAKYDTEEGGSAHLPHRSDAQMVQFLKEYASVNTMLLERIAAIGAGQITSSILEYRYDYADLGSDKSLLLWATKSVSPRPVVDKQVRVWKNGDKLVRDLEFSVSPSGVVLGDELVANDFCIVEIISSDQVDKFEEYVFYGASGSGSGNRTFALAELADELSDKSVSVFPDTASRCKVYRNGVKQTNSGSSVDFNFSGTGATATVTFTFDIASDERIEFEIWS